MIWIMQRLFSKSWKRESDLNVSSGILYTSVRKKTELNLARSINYNARKILAMKKDVRLRTGESLAEYYCRIYGHLLEDIEVWEVAEEGIVNIVRKKQINDSEMS